MRNPDLLKSGAGNRSLFAGRLRHRIFFLLCVNPNNVRELDILRLDMRKIFPVDARSGKFSAGELNSLEAGAGKIGMGKIRA
jgi:hypothetical protein